MKDTVSIIFGDSISYGLYDEETLGWVNRVKLNLNNNHYFFNLAIPGQSSKDILDKFEIELKNRYNEQDSFKLIFAFGIKDALLLGKDNNHINVFKENVLKIIKISKNYTEDINFIGLIKPNFNIDNTYYEPFFADFAFSFANEGMKAYYISETYKHIAVIKEINDEIIAANDAMQQVAEEKPKKKRAPRKKKEDLPAEPVEKDNSTQH